MNTWTMRLRLAGLAAVLAVTGLFSSAARADEPAPAHPVIGGSLPFVAAFGTSERTMIFTGLLLDPGLVAGVGLDLQYNGNLEDDKLAFNFALHIEYMLQNLSPFATGPELTYIGRLAPDAFEAHTLIPGWAFWYTPWAAPIGIGAGIGLQMTFQKDQDPVIGTIMFPLRVAWVIP